MSFLSLCYINYVFYNLPGPRYRKVLNGLKGEFLFKPFKVSTNKLLGHQVLHTQLVQRFKRWVTNRHTSRVTRLEFYNYSQVKDNCLGHMEIALKTLHLIEAVLSFADILFFHSSKQRYPEFRLLPLKCSPRVASSQCCIFLWDIYIRFARLFMNKHTYHVTTTVWPG